MKIFTVALLTALALGHSAAQAATITLPGDPLGGGQLNGTTFTIGTVGTALNTNNWPGGTPGEFPQFTIDGNRGTKYLNFGELNTGYIVTPAVGASNVTGLTLSTGGDAPERDPTTFSLYGSNTQAATTTPGTIFSLADFTPITLSQNSGLDTDPGRTTEIPMLTFTNPGVFTTYLLVFPTVRNAGAANSMQIGEAVLSGTVVPEPGSVALLATAAAGAIGFRGRRRA